MDNQGFVWLDLLSFELDLLTMLVDPPLETFDLLEGTTPYHLTIILPFPQICPVICES